MDKALKISITKLLYTVVVHFVICVDIELRNDCAERVSSTDSRNHLNADL